MDQTTHLPKLIADHYNGNCWVNVRLAETLNKISTNVANGCNQKEMHPQEKPGGVMSTGPELIEAVTLHYMPCIAWGRLFCLTKCLTRK